MTNDISVANTISHLTSPDIAMCVPGQQTTRRRQNIDLFSPRNVMGTLNKILSKKRRYKPYHSRITEYRKGKAIDSKE